VIALGYSLLALMFLGPWLFGAYLGWLWGRTWPGLAGAVGLGLALVTGIVGVFLLTFSVTDEGACSRYECIGYFGRWLDVWTGREWPLYAASAWTFCAIGFSWLRRSQERAEEPISFKAVIFKLFSRRGRAWLLAFLAAMLFVHVLYINVLYEGMATRWLVLVSVAFTALGLLIQSLVQLGRFGIRIFRGRRTA
jgi:hypothetical protein